MNIKVRLRVNGATAAEDTIEIEDHKLDELSEDEVERAVEIVVTQWANDRIEIDWDTGDEE